MLLLVKANGFDMPTASAQVVTPDKKKKNYVPFHGKQI